MIEKETFKIKFTKSVLVDVDFDKEILLPNYIGERVKQIKKEKKLRYKDMSLIAGFYSHSIWSRILKGTHNITTITLYKICKALDCKSSDLLPF
jgi:DNA-binding Xre family transcriptional regulator